MALVGAVAVGAGCERASPSRPDVVFVSLDTTRADHLGAYGAAVATPAIDRVASEGVVFDNVSAACTTTLPSHVSMFTGLWPHRHGVPRNGFTVHERNEMLPERLRDAGYETVGVSAAVALSKLLNFAQGFDAWDQDPETGLGHVVANREARRAGAITDAALSAVDRPRRGRAPRFFFVHYVDPHAPYDPPEPYRSRFAGPGADGSYEAVHRAQRRHRSHGGVPPSDPLRLSDRMLDRAPVEADEEDRSLAALYAGEVAYMDRELGRFFDGLRERGLYDDALIVVTADHGETLWEHADAFSHGIGTYETTVAVPLVVRLPGRRHAGQRVATPVSNVDIAPTVLAALGLALPKNVDGESLLPLLDGAAFGRDASFSQGPLPAGELESGDLRWTNERKAHSVRVGDWKLVRTPYLDREELFSLADDPGERVDRSDDGTPAVAARLTELRARLDAWMAAADPLPSEFFPRTRPANELEAAARRAMWERLEALGYVAGGDED